MSDISSLYIGLSGLDASQTSMDLIGQNLANASTPGYVDEEVELKTVGAGQATGPNIAPDATVGGGVDVVGVNRLSNVFLQSQMLAGQSASSGLEAQQSALTSIQTSFPEPANQGALSTQLTTYWNDWSQVANTPGDSGARNVLIDQGTALANSIQQASSDITAVSASATQQLSATVTSVNQLTSQIATLNQSIASVGSQEPDGALLDKRDTLMSQLSQDINIRIAPAADGTDTIYSGNVALVEGANSQALAVSGSGAGTQVVSAADGSNTNASGGTIGGLLSVLTVSAPNYQSQLDTVANGLIKSVNQLQSQGVDLTGATGSPFFTGTGAANIAVALTSPDQVAAASASSPVPTDPSTNLDGSNAAAVAELATANTVTIGSGSTATTIPTADAAYTSFVAGLGSDVARITSQTSAQSQVSTAASSAYQSQTGVDTNQELTELIQYQNSYTASAKYISTVQTNTQTLLSMIG
jgi:flagellar hook-associated protein 1 FlgK